MANKVHIYLVTSLDYLLVTLKTAPQLIAQGSASLSVTGSVSGVYSLNAVPCTLSVMGCYIVSLTARSVYVAIVIMKFYNF